MARYRNVRNDVVIELADDHDIELGPQWVEEGEAPPAKRKTEK